jgi:hypothetical protein
MITAKLVLVVLALVLFALAFFNVPANRFSLIAGGLFSWLLSTVV